MSSGGTPVVGCKLLFRRCLKVSARENAGGVRSSFWNGEWNPTLPAQRGTGVGDTVDVRRFACEPRPATDTDTGTVLQRGSGGRKVAVKIIDSAMDVHAVVEWFEAERRTLAFADSRR